MLHGGIYDQIRLCRGESLTNTFSNNLNLVNPKFFLKPWDIHLKRNLVQYMELWKDLSLRFRGPVMFCLPHVDPDLIYHLKR